MFLGIRKRLIGTYFLIIFITVAIFEFALIGGIHYYYLNSVRNNLENKAELASSFYNNFLDSGDIYSNSKQVIDIFAERSFQIQITDKRGSVIADSLGITQDDALVYEEVKAALAGKKGEFKGRESRTGERIFACTRPLTNNGMIIGALRFTTSLEQTYQVIKTFAQHLIVFGVILLVVVLLLSFFLAQTIVKPIEAITKTADCMAKGNLTVRNQVATDDELGILASSLNNMAAQIQKNEIMKNEFISSISHELRTPLTSIKGWAQTLKGTSWEDTDQMQYGLDIIVGEAERLREMVEELLDFSRLQAGKLKLYLEPTEINELITKTYEQMKPRAVKQGLNYTLNLPNEEYKLNLDPGRIKQVLINLLDNSLKFTGAEGTISLSGEKKQINGKDFYIITVKDSGCGIAEEELALIKEKFYKSTQESVEDKGTGLGLAICDELVQLHGGTLKINSVLKQGTTVTVKLPFTS